VVQNCQAEVCQAVDGVAVGVFASQRSVLIGRVYAVQTQSAAQCCLSGCIVFTTTFINTAAG